MSKPFRSGDPHCAHCTQCSPGTSVLSGAHPQVIERWNAAKRVHVYKRGHILFQEGQPCQGLYCVYGGRLKLYRTGPGGELQIVRLAGPHQILGHRSLFAGQTMSASAEIIQEATLCFVDKGTVLACAQQDQQVSHNLLRILAQELGQAEAQLLAVARLSAGVRLAQLFLEIADEDGKICELTREEIGQIIGITPESVSRALQSMARRGAIALHKRTITVADRTLLEEQAQSEGCF